MKVLKKIQSSEYITTYKRGHYGSPEKTSEDLWKKVGSADIYEYATNKSVQMVKIGDSLYGIDYRDSSIIKSEDVTEADLAFHLDNKLKMTEYTSF